MSLKCMYCSSFNITIAGITPGSGICGTCEWNLSSPQYGHSIIPVLNQHTPYPPDVEAYRERYNTFVANMNAEYGPPVRRVV